jgi:hypothetical protein
VAHIPPQLEQKLAPFAEALNGRGH